MPFSLYLLALAVFVMGTSEFMLAGLLPAIASDLEVTLATAGLLTSAFAVGMVVGAPLMAAFARRWPPRLTLVACLVVFAGCHVVGALTSEFSVLLITRVLSAFANAGFLAVALSTATTLVAADRKGRALAVLLSGTTIATVAGVPAGALLGTALGWRSTFWAIALLCLPAIVGVVRGVTKTDGQSMTGPATTTLRSELRQLASPRLILALTLGALINGGTFAAFTFLAPVVTETAGLDEVWVPVALVLFGIGSFAGVTVAGRLSDRYPGLVLAVGGPLLLGGWITMTLTASHPAVILVLVLAQGVLSFGVGSTLIARVLYAASGAPTMGGSYATAALNIGAAIGPVLGGWAIAVGAGLSAPMLVAAGLTAVALIMAGAARGLLAEAPSAVAR
ncbi:MULTISPECIES: Cmx/CmrA family chloramphenicol efflux MFS transporter [unclassified Microbacterium]|uniref:Cmx/CmrA family chloramphenicol efflux MFS transporter n=1 Tax=unclassified Microbacterium TaxID=2609290 RepID=UPI000EA93B02|nr:MULTISPECIES: Cmx/CmrA family chloramphenicol efflux MFS transporter [unclassified Microbacterium]MBT2484270.1 MFS transporter [Microbacterium sp. ISL-108]RKN67192.1 MFS transporter [Microbacterium sp. CGR2]